MQAHDSIAFDAIGTRWVIELFQPVSSDVLKKLKPAIADRIEQFDMAYSRFRPDSMVSAIASASGTYRLPDDAPLMIELYQRLYDITEGSVTPLIGQALSDAGYDASYSLVSSQLTEPPQWDDIMTFRAPELTVRRPALLDFGAAGKGYLADIIAELIEDMGVQAFCVDAGGDLVYRNPAQSPLHVGLEHPAHPGQAIGVAKLEGGALCGSAANRRAWGEYHHIIDPKHLQSPRHIAAVWVAAESALLADGLTTALYFAPPADLQAEFDFEWAIVAADYSLTYSPGFPAEFF